ncbi:hypothetical protein CsSME_00026126 [Camellia sinensis var. sinensis]
MFYLNDTKWGQPWQVVQQVQHRGVFDVPEVENINLVVPINIEDIIQFHRDDIEAEVIPNKTNRDGRDDEEDEELGILDDGMDPDMDYDIYQNGQGRGTMDQTRFSSETEVNSVQNGKI